jgi:hypothetical protein
MGESIVQVTEGTGKKLHTWNYTVGANTVEDEVVVPGPFPWATYEVHASGVSTATANDHLLCLNAGASLKVRVIRIRLEQLGNAAAAAAASISVVRTTTTTPTGGTAITANPFDTADAAAGAAGRSLPTVKGTETAELLRPALVFRQAVSATGAQVDDFWEWTAVNFSKAIVIPAGATNGLVVKTPGAVAGATVQVSMEFVETAF